MFINNTKTSVSGLDDDDVEHLNEVDNRKLIEERKQKEEEQKEMNDFRARVALLQETSQDHKLMQIAAQPKAKDTASRSSSQKAILTSAVKRKSQTDGKAASEPQEKRVHKLQQPSALAVLAVLPGIGGKAFIQRFHN
jgi:hypothetical protein